MYQIIPLSDSRALRRAFIEKFVDKTLPQYRAVMGHGDFYGSNGHQGYLWEVIRPYKLISEAAALELIAQENEVFVMWDLPLRNTSRALQKSRMIKLDGADLSAYLEKTTKVNDPLSFLPRNICVFDREVSFHVTFTVEYINGFGYVCLTSKTNIENDGISPAFRELFEFFHFGEREKN